MSTPAQTPVRPGMPPIEPTPDPVAVSEPGVGDASAGSGAAFAAAILAGSSGDVQAPQPQVPQPQVPQPQAPQPMPPRFPQTPAPAPGQPVVQAPQPPPPPPAPQSFTDRYAPVQPQDPLAASAPLPDVPPDMSPAAPQGMSDQQNHAWAGMRAQVGQFRRLAEEYREKYNSVVESAKTYQSEKAAFGDQLNQKDARIKELEDEIGRTDLSKSPEFREKYDAPLMALRDKIAAVFEANGIQRDAALKAADDVTTHPDQAPQIVAELPTHAQGQVMVLSEEADGLWSARDQALTDWRASAEGLAAVAQRGSAIISAQHVAQMADKAIQMAKGLPADKLAPAFQVTDPQFAAARDEQERLFKSWVQQAPEEQKYAAMFEGFMAPKSYEMLQQTWLENQRLKEMLYQRGRFGTPPVTPTYVPPATRPAPPPQVPTTATAGYAPATDPSAGFAATLVNSLLQ